MGSMYILDRGLPERARLKYYFPSTSQGKSLVVSMPFFENPKIVESKRSRLKKYSLISRSSNLYAYLGADSRKFSVDFFLTLPHILEDYGWITKDSIMGPSRSFNNTAEEKKKFKKESSEGFGGNIAGTHSNQFVNLEGVRNSALNLLHTPWGIKGMKQTDVDYIKTTYELSEQDVAQQNVAYNTAVGMAKTGAGFVGSLFTGAPPIIKYEKIADTSPTSPKVSKQLYDGINQRYKIIDLIIYWVNIIRSSVSNNASDPITGPPIIRLTHGLMYQNVPCICNDYSIQWDERMGYDLQTLLPRRIRISLQLEEFRTGDFGDYEPGGGIKGDNLGGYEAVISHATMDPGGIG